MDVRSVDNQAFVTVMAVDPNFQSCLNAPCPGGHIHDAGEAGANIVFTCDVFGSQVCMTHQVPMHTGQTCEQYDDAAQVEDTAKILEATESEMKKCAGCDLEDAKDGGCIHMTCKFCLGVESKLLRQELIWAIGRRRTCREE